MAVITDIASAENPLNVAIAKSAASMGERFANGYGAAVIDVRSANPVMARKLFVNSILMNDLVDAMIGHFCDDGGFLVYMLEHEMIRKIKESPAFNVTEYPNIDSAKRAILMASGDRGMPPRDQSQPGPAK